MARSPVQQKTPRLPREPLQPQQRQAPRGERGKRDGTRTPKAAAAGRGRLEARGAQERAREGTPHTRDKEAATLAMRLACLEKKKKAPEARPRH